MKLLTRPQSDLPRHDSLEALLASPADGIFFVRKPGKKKNPLYLQDCGFAPYVLRLVNPLLVPRCAIRWNLQFAKIALQWRLGLPTPPLPTGLFFGKADLLITADGHIIADSFSRGMFVHPGIVHNDDHSWDVRVSGAEKVIKGRFQYLEMVPGHFGHLLVDMPGRLWPSNEPGLEALADLPSVGFTTHGLRGSVGMPMVAARLLRAIGVAPDRITIADQPLRVAELLVAGRISPHRAPGGPRYSQLMAGAGRRLSNDTTGSAPLIYLSRSRLRGDRRPVSRKNARQIDDLFARHGFMIVHPQELDLAEQIAVVRGASHLAGFIGSQLHLAAFSERRGLKVLRICPDNFVTPTDRKMLAPIGGSVGDFIIKRPDFVRHLLAGMRLRPNRDDLDRLDRAIGAFVKGDATET